MTQRIELAGQKFGSLTATHYAGNNAWECICDCGVTKVIPSIALRRGLVKSCGCKRGEMISAHRTTHGMSRTPTYETWCKMIARCTKKNAVQYKYYGGRGITVCDRWLSFENFLTDMGVRPEGTSLDRIDNDGNYEPDNCRWATQTEQCNNTRRSVIYEGKTIKEWATILGISYAAVSWRLRKFGSVHGK